MFATSEAEGLFDQAVVQSGGEGHIDQDIAKKLNRLFIASPKT